MVNDLFINILKMSGTASVVILFVIAIRIMLKKVPKIFSYMLWTVVLLRLLCPITIESNMGIIPKNLFGESSINSFNQEYNNDININMGTNDNLNNGIINQNTSSNEGISNNKENNKIEDTQNIGLQYAVIIWVAGIILMIAYNIISFIKLKRRIIGNVKLKDNIYMSDYIDTPFVIGVFNPKIYIPTNIEKSEHEYIIAHEKQHIKRLDHITRIIGFMALIIHWFNPLVWVAFILSAKDMEMSCDEAVMNKIKKDIRVDYSKSLLKFATGRRMVVFTPLAFGEGETKGRIKNILKHKKPMLWVSVITCIIVMVAGIALSVNAKSNEQDLSLLNPKNLANVAFQSESDFNVTKEGDKDWSITPKSLGEFLKNDKFKEKEISSPLELIATYELEVNGFKIKLYESEPDLMMIYNENQYRYYKLEDAYEFFTKLLIEPRREGNVEEPSENSDRLDKAINSAILQEEGNRFSKNYDYICESHAILKEENKDNKVIVYLQVLFQTFNINNDTFTEEAGSYIPTVITFEINENKEYILREYWQPRDGSLNSKDIKSKFPEEIVDDAFDGQKYVIGLTQANYYKVINFAQIDVNNMISTIIEEIIPMEEDPSNWRLDAAKRDLIYFGKYMVAYAEDRVLEDISDREYEIINEAYEKLTDTSIVVPESSSIEDSEEDILAEYHELSDGTWKSGEYTYKYKLEINGRLNNAEKDITFTILSNIEDITFEQAYKASGLSSNSNDYFKKEDAVFVATKVE